MLQGNPWIYVPVLYFLQGVPYFVVNAISIIMFKKLGVPNDSLLGWIGLISWPWALKMFWSPLVDSFSTKRRWVLGTQILNALCILFFALTIKSANAWTLSLWVLGLAAVVSATHDIASDGFYLLALTHKERSFFVGLSSTSYRAARIFVTGLLVWIAGRLESQGISIAETWSKALLVGGVVYAVAIVAGAFTMPVPDDDRPSETHGLAWGVFREYFTQKSILIIVFFILFYRFGESMVGAMAGPFFLDSLAKGGMALSTTEVGTMTGVVGVLALTFGGIVGGMTLSKWGLKKCLLPMVITMYIPNLFYLWATLVKPAQAALYGIVFVHEFAYGFGFSAYLVFMMFIAQGSKFRTTHFAISTALMAVGATIAGTVSGFLQVAIGKQFGEEYGYAGFFLVTFLVSIPVIFLIRKLPLESEKLDESAVDSAAPLSLD